jgi:hypothetical protein
LWRFGGIFKISDLLAFEKGLQMVHRVDQNCPLPFEKESAIEASKRNQNIRISGRPF